MDMLTQTSKVIISSCLSFLAIVLFLCFKGKTRKFCMIAMLLSTAGDFFMTDTFHMGSASTYPGAAFFIAAHVVYALCFIRAGKEKGYVYRNKGFYAGLSVTVAVAILLAFLAFTVPDKPQTVMFCLIMVYLAVIGVNLVSQYSYAVSEKGTRLFLVLGMTLFIISDFVVFLPMLGISGEKNNLVWATYIPAQLLIILFNDKLKTDSRNTQ